MLAAAYLTGFGLVLAGLVVDLAGGDGAAPIVAGIVLAVITWTVHAVIYLEGRKNA